MFRIVFVIIFFINVIGLFSNEKIEYLFCTEEKRISEKIEELISNIKSKNIKGFVEMFTDNLIVYSYNKHLGNFKKDDFLIYENKELSTNDEVSIFYGILFDNDFTKKRFNRFSYSNGDFSVLIYKLPYDLPSIRKYDDNLRKKYYSQLPLYYVTLYWDKFDLASINIGINKEYKISSIKSHYSIGPSYFSKNEKRFYYVGANNVSYNDIQQKSLLSEIKVNTEIEIIEIFDDLYMKHNLDKDWKSKAVLVKSIPDGKTFYIPRFLISLVSDVKTNLINWEKWIYDP